MNIYIDWGSLYYGHVSADEIQGAVKDETWQRLRKAMKGQPLEIKYVILKGYQSTMIARISTSAGDAHEWRMVQVRLTNYVTALSRGGLIKPSDYRVSEREAHK